LISFHHTPSFLKIFEKEKEKVKLKSANIITEGQPISSKDLDYMGFAEVGAPIRSGSLLNSTDWTVGGFFGRPQIPTFSFELDASDGWGIALDSNEKSYFTAQVKNWKSEKILNYVHNGAVFTFNKIGVSRLNIKKYKKVEFKSNIKSPNRHLIDSSYKMSHITNEDIIRNIFDYDKVFKD
jgi:hypothetical protein